MNLILYNGAYNGPQIDAAISRALSGGEIDQRIGQVAALISAPTVAATAAAMTDTAKIYIYTGSEAGYNTGHWYYWDGAAWADGGAYQAAAADNALSPTSENAVQNKVINAAIDAAKAEAFAAAYDAYPTATIEDAAVASFTDGADGIPVKAMTVDVDPAQAAGTPSPSDPLPISGWTEANVVVSPTQDAGDGVTYTVNWQTEVGTIFGGTLTDNGDGTWLLNVEKVGITVDGTTTAIYGFDNAMDTENAVACYFTASPALVKTNDYSGKILCDKMPPLSIAAARGGSPFTEYKNLIEGMDCSVAGYRREGQTGNNYLYFSFNTTNYPAFAEKVVADANAWFAANPVQVVYELATPISYTLTAESVKTLLGDNNIWSDTGDVAELTYRADPTLFINSRINAIMAAIAEI